MRIVFFGTPEFAVPSLAALQRAGHDVALVVTQPDRPRGRHHSALEPCPVKAAALAAGLPVLSPERPRGEEFLAAVRDAQPDLGVVVAYGHLLRPELLAIPRLGMVNVHASLLPRWRGAAPIHWAIASGDAETGVAIMRVEEGLDSGGTWLVKRLPIRDSDTTGSLFHDLAELGAEALVEALPRIAAGEAPVPQPSEGVTLAPKVSREDARLDWTKPVREVSCRLRAMTPYPGAWTSLDGRDVKIGPAGEGHGVWGEGDHTPSGLRPAACGSFHLVDDVLYIQCADGWLPIGTVTPAGGRKTDAATWYRGARLAPDARFA
ncbi:MAG TPA: methionyl-tRNA formyltransferase [Gemmatimonadales bacterium]|nr:methionyl-tRNA formyltransferase [Gemmatimonadales bacterium]